MFQVSPINRVHRMLRRIPTSFVDKMSILLNLLAAILIHLGFLEGNLANYICQNIHEFGCSDLNLRNFS